MPTAVVVATIVNTNMSEVGFRQHVVEQLRVNDRSLRDRLADADGDANVVTAVLNLDEFLSYLVHRFPKAVDAAFAVDETHEKATAVEWVEAPADRSVDHAKMSEREFMNYILAQLESGELEPLVRFSNENWSGENGSGEDWEDDGDIGEDFSRHPFYY